MGIDVRYTRNRDFRVNISSYIMPLGQRAGIKVIVERRELERPWYAPWANPVVVWREIGAPRISIDGTVFSATGNAMGSPNFPPTVCNNISRCEYTNVAASARGPINGIRGTVTVILGVGRAPTIGPIDVSEGDVRRRN